MVVLRYGGEYVLVRTKSSRLAATTLRSHAQLQVPGVFVWECSSFRFPLSTFLPLSTLNYQLSSKLAPRRNRSAGLRVRAVAITTHMAGIYAMAYSCYIVAH